MRDFAIGVLAATAVWYALVIGLNIQHARRREFLAMRIGQLEEQARMNRGRG